LGSYYDDIAAVGPPTLAYHFPKVSPPGIAIDALARLPVVGLKDSSGDFERLRIEVTQWDQPVYTGASALLVRAANIGAAGALLSTANVDPERATAAWAGDENAQAEIESLEIAALKSRMADRFGTSPTTRI
jgi:dihydrodipicolinate synthase/N-acetylneuraminate lyase